MNRRTFFKWSTAVGTALFLPKSVRPSKKWEFTEDEDPIQLGDEIRFRIQTEESGFSTCTLELQGKRLYGNDDWVQIVQIPTGTMYDFEMPFMLHDNTSIRGISFDGRSACARIERNGLPEWYIDALEG